MARQSFVHLLSLGDEQKFSCFNLECDVCCCLCLVAIHNWIPFLYTSVVVVVVVCCLYYYFTGGRLLSKPQAMRY